MIRSVVLLENVLALMFRCSYACIASGRRVENRATTMRPPANGQR